MATMDKVSPRQTSRTVTVRIVDPQKLQVVHDRELGKLRELARLQRQDPKKPRHKALRYFGFA